MASAIAALHVSRECVKSRRAFLKRGVAQFGSASALGAEGRRFESGHPDGLSVVA